MRHARLIPLLLVAAFAACDRPRAPDPRLMVQRVMRGMFVYPGSQITSMSAGEDAAQATLSSPDSVAAVTRWFREALHLNGWALQSDVTAADSSISMVAMKGPRPLWLTFRANVGAAGTSYTMIGAVVAEGDSLQVKDSVK